jgi:hypothetical protein
MLCLLGVAFFLLKTAKILRGLSNAKYHIGYFFFKKNEEVGDRALMENFDSFYGYWFCTLA